MSITCVYNMLFKNNLGVFVAGNNYQTDPHQTRSLSFQSS